MLVDGLCGVFIPHTIHTLTYFIHLPMKMEPTVSSETSEIRTQTPGNYPKRNKLQYLYYNHSYMFRYTRIILRDFQSSVSLTLRSFYIVKIH